MCKFCQKLTGTQQFWIIDSALSSQESQSISQKNLPLKTTLGEIQNTLDNQSNQSEDLKNKIENCCDSIVKAQQKMEEKSEKFGNVDEKNQGYRNRYNLIDKPKGS